MHLIWLIIVGLIAGWATGKIMRSSGQGVIADTLIGIAGAIVGGWIMRAAGFRGQGGTIYTILVAIGGAIVLTWLYRLIFARRRELPAERGERGDRGGRDRGDRGDSNFRRAA